MSSPLLTVFSLTFSYYSFFTHFSTNIVHLCDDNYFVLFKKVIRSAYHWAIFRFKLDVNETIILATEQGAQKKRFRGRREERNSCFLTEEAQMEARVLLSTTITTALRWGWRESRPAARTNTDTDYTTRTRTSLFK